VFPKPIKFAEMHLKNHNDMMIILSGKVHIQRIDQLKRTGYAVGSYKNQKNSNNEGGNFAEDYLSSADSFCSDSDESEDKVYMNAI
jgi:hypothetical protein